MKTYIVLIAVDGSILEPRKACEILENTKFKIGGSIQTTAIDVRTKVMHILGVTMNLTKHSDLARSIEVEPITDFMDRVNDEAFNPDDYFMSYVYA